MFGFIEKVIQKKSERKTWNESKYFINKREFSKLNPTAGFKE
jgi:hypothetical protein